MFKKTQYLAGSKLQYDLPTKCRAVQEILSMNYSSNEDLNSTIKSVAKYLNVTPITLKTWIRKYQHIYKQGINALPGTRSIAPTIVDPAHSTEANKQIEKLKEQLATLEQQYCLPANTTISISTLKTTTKVNLELIQKLQGL